MQQKLKIMFDTMVYDKLINQDQKTLELIKNQTEIFITHIQLDELNKMLPAKKEKLGKIRLIMKYLNPQKIATNSAFFDISSWDDSGWGNDNNVFENILNGNNKNAEDALIADTAHIANLILITEEKGNKGLAHKSIKNGLPCLSLEQLLKKLI